MLIDEALRVTKLMQAAEDVLSYETTLRLVVDDCINKDAFLGTLRELRAALEKMNEAGA